MTKKSTKLYRMGNSRGIIIPADVLKDMGVIGNTLTFKYILGKKTIEIKA